MSNTNHVICRNEVFIEEQSVGQFQSFSSQSNARSLGATAVLTLPMYALGAGSTQGRASSRIRQELQNNTPANDGTQQSLIKVCAQIEVRTWYEAWDNISNTFVAMDTVIAFSGFIAQVVEGFPAKLHLQDNSFILRFGAIEKGWDEDATAQDIVEDCIPIANDGFREEREKLGFTREVPALTYSTEGQNVQASTTSLSFRNWGGRSPYESIQKLMSLMMFYGGVSEEFNVFIGIGVTENDRPIIQLDTRYNVIGRNIVGIDGRFVDYDVKVVGILANGRQYTATGGYRTSRSSSERSEYEKAYGQPERGHSSARSVEGIQEHADEMLKMLKEERNKGTITLLLYPSLKIMDWVVYTDSVFNILSSGYYVVGYSFSADDSGYFQTLTVSDKIFNL